MNNQPQVDQDTPTDGVAQHTTTWHHQARGHQHPTNSISTTWGLEQVVKET
jgi:hypothetical protein